MKKALVDRIPFTKIVVVLAICAGVAVGLCGVGFAIGLGTKFSGTGSGGARDESFSHSGRDCVLGFVAGAGIDLLVVGCAGNCESCHGAMTPFARRMLWVCFG